MTTATSPDRYIDLLPLESIPRAERNAKNHDIPRIRGALTKFGCTVAGIIDERTGRLVAGHGRLETLERMRADGAKPPAGVQVSDDGAWLAPIVRGWASANDAEADAYGVVDNRLSELGGWDMRTLPEILQDVADYNVDLLDIAGYDHTQLDDMIAELGDVEIMPPSPTGARYAETEEQMAARREVAAGYTDTSRGGALTEMILVFNVEDHREVISLIGKIRTRDGDQVAAQIVLEALRAYADEDGE
ncbi:hypothetical protein [Microbispora sp. NPDC049125]|uniref:hypothetical protein n=1 Tax=Microbispora sp. NPDC049125 TaxID=3154929 RepID=UPI0034674053